VFLRAESAYSGSSMQSPMLNPSQIRCDHNMVKSEAATRLSVATVADCAPQQPIVPEAVRAVAARWPLAVALSSDAEVLTYADLDRRSNQLAACLKSMGVGCDQLVGLCMERTPSMVIAALAILKAGGAYVPFDPALPAERLSFMLRDAGVCAVVTENAYAAKLPAGDWRVINVNRQAEEIASFSCNSLPCPASSENLAYVIYTSGSTG